MFRLLLVMLFSLWYILFGYAMQFDDQTLAAIAAKRLVFSPLHFVTVPELIPREIKQRLINTALALRITPALYPLELRQKISSPARFKGVCGIEGDIHQNQIMAIDCDGNLVLCPDHDLINCISWQTQTDPSATTWNDQTKQLLLGQRNGKISIIDMANSEQLQIGQEFYAHSALNSLSRVESLSFYENRLISAGMDGAVRVWNDKNVTQMTITHDAGAKNAHVTVLQQLVSASADGAIRVTDFETQAMIAQFKKGSGRLSRMQLLEDPHLVVFAQDNQISAIDTRQAGTLFNVSAHSGPITTLIVSGQSYFASGSFDKSVKLWDVRKPMLVAATHAHTQWIQSLAHKQDILISGSRDATVRIWDAQPVIQSIKQLSHLPLEHIQQLTTLIDQEKDLPILKATLLQKITALD